MAKRVRGSVLESRTNAVYYWEHLFAGSSYFAYMDHKEFRWMMRDIARQYGIPIPHLYIVNQPNNTAMAWAVWEGHPKVVFNRHFKSVTAMILVHEMSHLVVSYYGFEDDSKDHGPIWMGLFVRLMHEYAILPFSASEPSLRTYGFDYLHPHFCHPDRLWDLEDAFANQS
jgi:hypothetical protein